MCGRYTLKTPAARIAETFGLAEMPELTPRYNIAPTQAVLAIREDQGRWWPVMLRWGLVPFWAKEPSIGNRMINARAESVADKPAYRRAFQKRRCLIVADGFYEWQKTASGKQPRYIHLGGGELFTFAGLWERWEGSDEPLETCTIITTAASPVLAAIHDRMPVVVPEDQRTIWLSEQTRPPQLKAFLDAVPEVDWQSYQVSKEVNSPRHEGAELIEPAVTS